jgi:Cys-tRNA(Pro)/Cys-tRNA(Cys) deacylase
MIKTNAARILDRHGIKYELIQYEVDESDLSATTVAQKVGQEVEQVFKTLVLRGDKTGVVVMIIPGGEELDLKKSAKVSGNKNLEMVPMKDLLSITGYVRGGCTAIGMKKNFQVYIHESCKLFDSICISAGMRGLQVKLDPEDLIKVTNALVAKLS